MSPFRRSSHHLPPTPSSGLRGMGGEGLRRRGGREGGERERVGWEGEEKGGRGVGEVMREYFEQNYLRPFEGWRQTGVALGFFQFLFHCIFFDLSNCSLPPLFFFS